MTILVKQTPRNQPLQIHLPDTQFGHSIAFNVKIIS